MVSVFSVAPVRQMGSDRQAPEMIKRKSIREIMIWSIVVLLISLLCYVPMLFDRIGFSLGNVFLNAKYLFVVIPFAVSMVFVVKEHVIKQWLSGLFRWKRFSVGALLSLAFAAAGIALTGTYSLVAEKPGVFSEKYSDFSSVLVQCIYFFAMAFIEEMAWRGFLLHKLSVEREAIRYTLITGVIWGIWHIPMWSIRNMQGIGEISLLFVWSVLIAMILGTMFYKYHNILLCALLHTIFNICFLAPVSWNIVVIMLILFIAGGMAWKKKIIQW